jgi:hypothetical protein
VSGCGCGKGCWTSYDPAVRERAAAAAALIMWAATGRRYGPCEVTVVPSGGRRPVPLYRTDEVGGGYGISAPVIDGGVWYNRPILEDGSCCGSGCEVPLEGPTTKAQVSNVTVAGVTVDPAGYVVVDGYLLVRTDGACWPTCASVATPSDFSVTYSRGLAIPAAVQGAYERLACEMAKACTGAACALPQRMTRLTRQGVEIELEQVDTETPGALLTGIKDVDDVILMINPYRLAAAPAVLSPDMPAARRLT